jgi:hypothetical protein
MNDGRKNLLGDLLVTSVTGCSLLIGIMAISMVFLTSLGIILSLFL